MANLSQACILVTVMPLELAMAGFVQNSAAEGGPKTPVPAATGHAEAIFQPFRLDLTSLGQVHPGSSVLG